VFSVTLWLMMGKLTTESQRTQRGTERVSVR
jgi:hypothetical protein